MAFIVLEGLDGSGKSTQAARLGARLTEQGFPHLLVSDPGHTPLGELVKQMVNDPAVPMSREAELMLFYAARAQVVATQIRPALQRGLAVISDRFTASTMAYQGAGRGMDHGLLEALNRFADNECKPTLQILLKLDWAAARKRLNASKLSRFEQQGDAFYSRVQRKYEEMADSGPGWAVVDATQPEDDLFNAVYGLVSSHLGLAGG